MSNDSIYPVKQFVSGSALGAISYKKKFSGLGSMQVPLKVNKNMMYLLI